MDSKVENAVVFHADREDTENLEVSIGTLGWADVAHILSANIALTQTMMDVMVAKWLGTEGPNVVAYVDVKAQGIARIELIEFPKPMCLNQKVDLGEQKCSVRQICDLVIWWMKLRSGGSPIAESMISFVEERLVSGLHAANELVERGVLLKAPKVAAGTALGDEPKTPVLSVEIEDVGSIEVALSGPDSTRPEGKQIIIEASFFNAFIRDVLTKGPGEVVGKGTELESTMPTAWGAPTMIAGWELHSTEQLIRLAMWWIRASRHFQLGDLADEFAVDEVIDRAMARIRSPQ